MKQNILRFIKQNNINIEDDIDDIIIRLRKEYPTYSYQDCLYYVANFLNIPLKTYEITQRWLIEARSEEEAKQFFADSSWLFSEDVMMHELNN